MTDGPRHIRSGARDYLEHDLESLLRGMEWTLSEGVYGEERLQSVAPTPAAIVQHLRQLAALAKDVDGPVDLDVNPEAYWKREVTYLAARLSELNAPPGGLLEAGIITAYFAGVARTHLEELVVDQPSLGKPLARAAEYGHERAQALAAGGRKGAQSRSGWEVEGLALAQRARAENPYISSDEIAGRIEALLALRSEKERRRKETILKRIAVWEAGPLLKRRVKKSR